MVKAATYAVTVEQAGGSPDGNPHSAPVFSGKLIEAVPPRCAGAGALTVPPLVSKSDTSDFDKL